MRWLPSIALVAAVWLADRASKLWIQAQVGLYDTIEIVPGLFNIVHSENRGMAFGLGNEGATVWSRALLIVVSLAVLGFLAYSIRNNTADRWAMLLVAAGALGNLYDRVLAGQVTDFLDLYWGTYHWATFNVADMAVTLGAVWIGWNALHEGRKQGKKESNSAVVA
jgi:signal peptidase II